MIETIISRPALLVDLPEVRDLKAQFVYNYFMPDERVNETPDSNGNSIFISTTTNLSATEDTTLSVNTTAITDSKLSEFYGRNANFPRYVKLSFQNPNIETSTDFSNRLGITSDDKPIPREAALNVFGRVGVAIIDTTIDKTVYRMLSGSVASTDDSSLSIDVTQRLISAIVNSIQPDGYRFASTDARSQPSNAAESIVQGIEFGFSYDTKFAATIASGSINSSKNIFVDEISKTIQSNNSQDLELLQSQAVASSNPYSIRVDDYEETFTSIYDKVVDDRSPRKLKNFLVGFIVQKFSTQTDGTQALISEKFSKSPNATTILDANVAYGKRYRYNVIAIYACQFEMIQQVERESDRTINRTVLFASRGSAASVVCEENIAPPPPVDLRFKYRGDNSGLNVTWNFPINLQRDIKKFQVFRRASTAEPFQLIKMYDFDDSVVKSSDPEQVPERLISRSILPTSIHQDKDFNKNSRFIYAICAIDAHGLTSNFSVQLEASYDRYRNKINTRVISRSDAPKPYPNIFLNRDTFIDTMKMSGYTRLNLYFDPELIKVTDGNGRDLHHIISNRESGEDNTYKLMIVNTDFQQSQVLDIKINDSFVQPAVITPTTARVFSPT